MVREGCSSVLVTDFDGTLTQHDFYRLVLDELVPAGTPDYWSWYLAHKVTHFEALRLTFGSAPAGEAKLVDVARRLELQPGLDREVEALRNHGWDVVVASAGCGWYIERLLKEANVHVDVHANPGEIEDGRLMMRLPVDSPYFSQETGINKPQVVKDAIARFDRVAFAGDGLPDLAPALLVPAELRFARGLLAETLTERGEPFRRFGQWAEVARALCAL